MGMRHRFFLTFQITPQCMKAGVREESQYGRDVFDNLATKLRADSEVNKMLERVQDGTFQSVLIGIGRECVEE